MADKGDHVDVSKAKVLERKPLDQKDAKWIRMTSIKYADPTGRERLWEAAERTTKPSTADVDAVGIVAILRDSSKSSREDDPRIVLIKQFRPPTNSPVVEVPAGLMDANESPAQCAVRELREETGYTASSDEADVMVGPKLWNDPGMVATTVRMVHVVVDVAREENKEGNLKKSLEGGEFTEVFTVGVKELAQRCRQWDEEGLAVDARVGGLAEGVEMAARLALR